MKFRNPLVNLADLGGQITTDQLGDGVVTEPKIGAAAVTAPKLSPLAVDTPAIALSAIEADRIADAAVESAKLATNLQSDNYMAGSAGWFIGRGFGSAEFNNVTVRGVIIVGAGSDMPATYISSGNISSASITLSGTGSIASSNYVAGVSGFAIDGAGDAEFNDVTVRGAIEVGAGSDVPAGYITTGTMSAATITLDGPAGVLQSAGFVSGSAGFRVRGGGDAEFNNVTVRGTIYATSGELGNLDVTGTLQMNGGKIITAGTSDTRIEMSSGADSNVLKFFSDSPVGEMSPSAISVVNWGASGWSIVMSAGQETGNINKAALVLGSPTFAGIIAAGASLATQYSNLNLAATAAGADVNITAGADINLVSTGGGSVDVAADLKTSKLMPRSASADLIFADGAGTTRGYYDYSAGYWRFNTARFDSGTMLRNSVGNIVMSSDSNYTTLKSNEGQNRLWLGDSGVSNTVWLNADRFNIRNNVSAQMLAIYQATGAQTRVYGPADTQWLEWDYTNRWFQFFINSEEQMRIGDTGSTSLLSLRDGLTNVGNHETLRLNRGTGSTLQLVGYYSSYIKDPDTGKILKRNVVPLASPRSNHHWRREWYRDLEPIKYDRGGMPREKRPAGYRQRELGFSIENLLEHTNLLTTKGSLPGGSPDEYALLAVTVDQVQHLEARIEVLEALLSAA